MKQLIVLTFKKICSGMVGVTSVATFLLSVLSAGLVSAADEYNLAIMGDYKQPGKVNGRDVHGGLGSATVDPLSGMLKHNVVDLNIPGNSGLDIVVQRYYTGLQHATAEQGTPLRGRSVVGLGWDMHMGRIWTHEGNTLATGSATGCRIGQESSKFNPVLELADGSRKQLINNDDSSYAFVTADFWVARCLLGTEDNGYGGLKVYSSDGNVYTFADYGYPTGSSRQAYLLSKLEDPHGNSLTFKYENTFPLSGLGYKHAVLKEIISSDNRKITFSYDDISNEKALLKQISSGGRTVRYTYELLGADGDLLTKVTRPDNSSWKYDYYDDLVGSAVGRNALKSITNPLSMTTTYKYGEETFNQDGLDISWVVKEKKTGGSVTTAGTWTYEYSPATIDTTTIKNAKNCTVYKHRGERSLTVSGPSNITDDLWLSGTLISEAIYGPSCTGLKQLTEYTWHKQHISSQNEFRPIPGGGGVPASFVIQTDSATPVLEKKVITQNGLEYVEMRSEYDDVGNPGRIERSQKSPSGQLGQPDDAEEKSRTTLLEYTNPNDVWMPHLVTKKTIDTIAGDQSFTFDDVGLLKEENLYGVKTKYVYDSSGNLIKRIDANDNESVYSNYYRGVPRSESLPEGVSITRTVDYFGNITKEVNGDKETSYTYDKLNRLTGIITPRADDNNVTVAYAYSASSGLIQTTVRGGLTKTETYDGAGLLSKSTVSGAGKNIQTTFDYDVLGRRVFVSYPNGVYGVRSAYDELDRMTSETITADGSITTYAYANGNNSVAIKDPRGNTTTYYYVSYGDPRQRELIKIESPESIVTEMERNDLGMLEKLKQGGKSIIYEYNTRWQKVREFIPGVGTLNYTNDSMGNVIETWTNASPKTFYSYDGLHRLSGINYPASTPDVEYFYDTRSNLIGLVKGDISWVYTHDDNDRLQTETLTFTADNESYTVLYGRNKNGVVDSITYPNNETIDYSPDGLGRPTKVGSYISNVTFYDNGQLKGFAGANGVTTALGQDNRLRPTAFDFSGIKEGGLKFTYGYDTNNNVDTVTDHIDAENNLLLAYDGMDRLRNAMGWWGAATFDYDQRGNMTLKSVENSYFNYQYDNDRLVGIAGGLTHYYNYDEYGNINQRDDIKFIFDHASNMIKTENDGSQTREYRYDGHNRRVWDIDVESDTVAKYTLYNHEGRLLYEIDPDTGSTDTYLYLGNLLVVKKHNANP